VEEFFTRADIPYDIPEDMIRALWKKFIANVGGNQVSALLGCKNGAFKNVASVRDLAVAAAREAIEVSKAEGTGLVDEDISALLDGWDRLDPDGKTSMLQDMEAGRKTEVDTLGGVVVELSAKHRLRAPVNEMLVRCLHAKEDIMEFLR
jgi:2-dehydropantoate 2-reductase